ncbi:MAG: L,D-transpeptidase family protein [Pseudomonadota bacterium]
MICTTRRFLASVFAVLMGVGLFMADVAHAQVTAFKQAVAEAAANDRAIAAFYQANDYRPIWTGRGNRDRQRRQAFLRAISEAHVHGLPAERYNPDLIRSNVSRVQNERDLGRLEVEMTRLFLTYARDVQTGVLTPSRIDEQIVREVPLRPRQATLAAFARSSPAGFIRALPPRSPEYQRLLKEKMQYEKLIGSGGWGEKVQSRKLEAGQSGPAVVQLRNRMIRMGYMRRSSSQTYDGAMMAAVQAFQRDHGLAPDGIAGEGTLAEVNRSPADRLASILVAMERERWMNMPQGRGDRHVWVNLADFRTKLYDDGKVTFETRSVIGERLYEKRSPEFSDMIEYMEINPDWTVPRSILGRDYLPKLQQNPYAASYLQLIDRNGRLVDRSLVDFRQYTEKTFPFTVRQPPGRDNALGTVKFMFPNPYAIYLHDTPARHLFSRETRAYSSGCIRLHDPHDFAYVLLSRQMSDPEPYFQSILRSGRQTIVELETPVPVHLVYRTAFTEPKGRIQFRRDVYGRDALIFRALQNAGVSLRAVQG